MPPKKSHSKNKQGKKKKKNHNKARSATNCAECGKPVQAANKVDCVCTRVVFCGAACSTKGNVHKCPGAPDPLFDLQQRMNDLQSSAASGITRLSSTPHGYQTFEAELRRDIVIPLQEVLVEEGLHGRLERLDKFSAEVYRKYADRGSAASAYQAGILYKNRWIGNLNVNENSHVVLDARTSDEQRGVLDTDELAFQYLEQAAKAGIPLAMQSLSAMYEEGQGCRKSWRLAREWLWRAVLLKSAGAAANFDAKIVLRNEIYANVTNLEHVLPHLLPGQGFSPSGPNAASLLLVFWRQLQRHNFQLPAFAGTVPSCRVGTRVRQGTAGPVAFPASKELIQLGMAIRHLERRNHSIHPIYGRRGIAKQATAQTFGHTDRSAENQLFCVPPAPACDEQPDNVSNWVAQARRSGVRGRELRVHCVHEQTHEDAPVVCKDCIEDALERMQAVATNSVALSMEEALQSRGQCAIWRTPGGKLKSETFKDYCRAEVECTLAAMVLARNDYDTPIATPLFVAQDPNLYWPLICDHGCIRAALEYVAPHVDWTQELGLPKTTPPQIIPVVTSERCEVGPKRVLRKCGNNLCLKMEPYRDSGDFFKCSRCDQREYCSKDCALQDLHLHKHECVAGAGKLEPVPKFPDTEPKKRAKDPEVNEEVVVHGLKAKPEYNGKIGRISGALSKESRYPVELYGSNGSHQVLSVKPVNLYRLGVVCQESTKRGRKFRCVHGMELCNDCQLDLVVVNQLWKLHFSGEALSRTAIDQVGEYHFARLEDDDKNETGFRASRPQYSMEGHGLKSDEKKVLLKYLLAAKDRSETTVVAIVGLTCYSSRDMLASRANVAQHGESLVKLWKKG